jgi:hypothetical protein
MPCIIAGSVSQEPCASMFFEQIPKRDLEETADTPLGASDWRGCFVPRWSDRPGTASAPRREPRGGRVGPPSPRRIEGGKEQSERQHTTPSRCKAPRPEWFILVWSGSVIMSRPSVAAAETAPFLCLNRTVARSNPKRSAVRWVPGAAGSSIENGTVGGRTISERPTCERRAGRQPAAPGKPHRVRC